MPEDRVVAVGLLTARDLDVLGKGFKRCFTVPEDAPFEALLAALRQIPASGEAEADQHRASHTPLDQETRSGS